MDFILKKERGGGVDTPGLRPTRPFPTRKRPPSSLHVPPSEWRAFSTLRSHNALRILIEHELPPDDAYDFQTSAPSTGRCRSYRRGRCVVVVGYPLGGNGGGSFRGSPLPLPLPQDRERFPQRYRGSLQFVIPDDQRGGTLEILLRARFLLRKSAI